MRDLLGAGLLPDGLIEVDLLLVAGVVALLELAKALDNVKDGSGKTAAIMAILGKSGAQMLPLAKPWSAAA